MQYELLERERELSQLKELLERARAGSGAFVAILGEPGVGKSSLVAQTAERAREMDIEVLYARGGELEAQLPFGVVRQLFETRLQRAGRGGGEELFDGAAELARPVFDLGDTSGVAASEDPPFAVLHGLYWLVANIAALSPVALLIDDVHWADSASRRWLDYLVRRIEPLPLLVAVAARVTELSSGDQHVDVLLDSSPATVIRPCPLTADGSARLLRLRWPDADAAFCDACHDATAGNPFLLGELVADLMRERVEPRERNAGRVEELGPEAVSRAVVGRLARLPHAAESVARAVAVLSAGPDASTVAGLTELDEPDIADARDALTAAGILDEQRALEFVHPIVRRAVYSTIPPSERAVLHYRAARLLESSGAPPEAIASHLLNAEPAGASWVVAALRAAAARAGDRGAPEAAVAYLRRALAEPPLPAVRSAVLLSLGNAELQAGELVDAAWGSEADSPAVRHLREAVELTDDPAQRADAAVLLGDALWARDRFPEAAAVFDAAAADLRGRDRELELWLDGHFAAAARLTLSAWPLVGERLARFRAIEGRTAGERLVAGVLAVDAALSGARPEVVAELAERAVAGGALLGDRAGAHVPVFAANALMWADQLDRSDRLLEQLESQARRRGSVRSLAIASCWRSAVAHRAGRLGDAETAARMSLELAAIRGWGGMPATWAFLLEALVAQGELTAARDALERSGLGDSASDYGSWGFFLHGRARLRLAVGDIEPAIADLRACGRRMEGWGAANPSVVPWRSSLAEALAAADEREEALALVADEVALARRVGAPRALGIALRVEGALTAGEAGLRMLREAIASLEHVGARLELAVALYELGRVLQGGDRRSAAREPLRRSMLLAHRCGARLLAEQARHELVAAGWRPEPLRMSPFDALGATERRVVELVAKGVSDREIAQSLFITERTVADRIARALEMLHVSSRAELAQSHRARRVGDEGTSAVYPAGLTAREVDVLKLVARGFSNPEVAAELVVSPRTVHAHLRSVYRKLDVHSRAAAARSAAELGLT